MEYLPALFELGTLILAGTLLAVALLVIGSLSLYIVTAPFEFLFGALGSQSDRRWRQRQMRRTGRRARAAMDDVSDAYLREVMGQTRRPHRGRR